MSNETLRIVFAAIDTEKLTLYKEDGETIVLKQGDPRLLPALEAVKPLDFKPYVDIQLVVIEKENDYENFEKKSSGIVKFFRVAKAKLKGLFTPELTPATHGSMPMSLDEKRAAEKAGELVKGPQVNQHTEAAVAEIMKHAQPVAAKTFNEDGLDKQGYVADESGNTPNGGSEDSSPDTMVAVVDGKIIPGVEKIRSQIARASNMGNTEGIDLFMLRLASVIEQRHHSVEDLLRFLERGDMPISDDGSILIYKLLYRKGFHDGKPAYVDCHSRKVTQWVGAHVCMDEKLVDPNRRNECSNGLHVARRGYLRSFSGNVCVLAKLAPEDVIAVPHGDANKMRVCGYHIIAELTDDMKAKVKANKPITDTTEGQELLARAMRGQHVGITDEVRVTGHRGGGLQIKKLTGDTPPIVSPVAETRANVAVPEAAPAPVALPTKEVALENPEEEKAAPAVDPKSVLKEQTIALSRKEQAKLLFDAWMAAPVVDRAGRLEVLMAFKKAAKVGWDRLGIPDPETQAMVSTGNKPVAKHADKVKPSKVAPKAEFIAKGVPAGKPVTDLHTREVIGVTAGSYKDRIQKLLALGNPDKELAQKIYELKKQSKKSWEVLGVSSTSLSIINRLLGK